MSSKFECIRAVKDTHFHKKLKDLYDRCVIIEEMEQKSPADCVSMIRKQNERLVKYLYCRFNKIESTRLTTFEILQNKDFIRKIANPTLIKAMDRLRFDGNEATHEDYIDVDGPMAAGIAMATFSLVVERVCEKVDTLPPARTGVETVVVRNEDKPRLKGKVSITLKETPTERGTIHRCLVAEIKDTNASKEALRYKWVEIQASGENVELQRGRLNHFDLPAETSAKTYQCIVTSAETMGKRESRKYSTEVISSEKTTQKNAELPQSSDLIKKTTKSASEVPEHKDDTFEVTTGPAIQSMQKKEIPSSKRSKEKKVENKSLVSSQAVAHHNAMVHPMKLPNQKILLFDSTYGLVHYFVRPNDEFVLNSLELLGADAYLYRLLRQEGYDRIAFVDVGNADCRIYAYDLDSESIFKANPGKGKKGLQGTMLGGTVQPVTQTKVQPLFGKREVRRLSRGEEFKKQFVAEISSALGDKRHKTAIVMPMLILEKDGYYGDEIVDTINRIEREGNQGNILIFTMVQRDDIVHCFSEQGRRIHSWVSPIMNKAGKEAIDRTSEAIESLRKRGLIVLADEYEVDEIANLLFRKKLVKTSGRLVELPASKIYPLAVKLKEHCLQVRKHFNQIGYQNRKDSCIRQLNALLDREDVQKELIQVAAKVKESTVGFAKKLQPVLLERVYHISLDRFEDDSSIEEIIAEFDKLAGTEMQTAKREVIMAANEFAWEHQKNQRRMDAGEVLQPGDWPFMALRFIGPPGTGKTTVAGLTARYMHAKKILPKSKLTEASATRLLSSNIGGTAENIRRIAEQADGGILFIDEFHAFDKPYQGSNIAKEAMEAIVSVLNEHKESLCLIIAGYENGVKKVLQQDVGANSRFHRAVQFNNYSDDVLMDIFRATLSESGRDCGLTDEAEGLVRRIISSDKRIMKENFANARYSDDLAKELLAHSSKIGDDYTAEDIRNAFPNKREIMEAGDQKALMVLEKYSQYRGAEMEVVRNQIKANVDYFGAQLEDLHEAEAAGEYVDSEKFPYMNMVFFGPPGTGKTTAAKFAAEYLNAKNILPRDSIETVQAKSLVRGIVGETAKAIREAAEKANGGVLLIDEFGGLLEGHSGGNIAESAMSALVGIVNEYKDSLCVILAGYKNEVLKILNYDAGAGRRFYNRIEFRNYSLPTLMEIFDSMLLEDKKSIEPEARDMVETVVYEAMNNEGEQFGNAGFITGKLRDQIGMARVARDKNDKTYRVADIKAAFPEIEHSSVIEKAAESVSIAEIPSNQGGSCPDEVLKRPDESLFRQLTGPYPMEKMTAKNCAKLIEPAVLLIKAKVQGTGFLVRPDGYVLTCEHVVRGANKIEAIRRVQKSEDANDYEVECYVCKVVYKDVFYDIALLKFESKEDALPYLLLGPISRIINRGEDYIISGYPELPGRDSTLTLYSGQISAAHEMQGLTLWYIDGKAQPGNSGSPVVSLEDCSVIGILKGGLEEGDMDDNYMIPIRYFWDELLG